MNSCGDQTFEQPVDQSTEQPVGKTDKQSGGWSADLPDDKLADKPKEKIHLTVDPVTWILVLIFVLNYFIHARQFGSDSLVFEIFNLFGDLQRKGNNRPNKPYSRKVMIFCLTLAGYSAKAYRYLRWAFQNCLPAPKTLQRYRNRIDGSPGFSLAALKMIKNKVLEMRNEGNKLFLSLSCDDISIRYIFLYN